MIIWRRKPNNPVVSTKLFLCCFLFFPVRHLQKPTYLFSQRKQQAILNFSNPVFQPVGRASSLSKKPFSNDCPGDVDGSLFLLLLLLVIHNTRRRKRLKVHKKLPSLYTHKEKWPRRSNFCPEKLKDQSNSEL